MSADRVGQNAAILDWVGIKFIRSKAVIKKINLPIDLSHSGLFRFRTLTLINNTLKAQVLCDNIRQRVLHEDPETRRSAESQRAPVDVNRGHLEVELIQANHTTVIK